jgi:hypothetical protein
MAESVRFFSATPSCILRARTDPYHVPGACRRAWSEVSWDTLWSAAARCSAEAPRRDTVRAGRTLAKASLAVGHAARCACRRTRGAVHLHPALRRTCSHERAQARRDGPAPGEFGARRERWGHSELRCGCAQRGAAAPAPEGARAAAA